MTAALMLDLGQGMVSRASRPPGTKKGPLQADLFFVLAERPGFEPGLPFQVNTLSKRAP